VSITKVVVFFTRNPAKLGLHFLMFLRFSREFTRFSKSCNTIQETILRAGPWNSQFLTKTPLVRIKNPGTFPKLAMWPLGHGGGGAGPNSGDSALESAGEREEDG
jgi:hypothetical protein